MRRSYACEKRSARPGSRLVSPFESNLTSTRPSAIRETDTVALTPSFVPLMRPAL